MFYEKDRRLGELNEKIKRKAHVKQSFSLDFLERGTFTEYPFLDADNTDLLSSYPCHPCYPRLKGRLLRVLIHLPVFLFLNFERHFLIFPEYAGFKSGNQISVLIRYIYLIATRASADIAFACFGKESISGAAGT